MYCTVYCLHCLCADRMRVLPNPAVVSSTTFAHCGRTASANHVLHCQCACVYCLPSRLIVLHHMSTPHRRSNNGAILRTDSPFGDNADNPSVSPKATKFVSIASPALYPDQDTSHHAHTSSSVHRGSSSASVDAAVTLNIEGPTGVAGPAQVSPSLLGTYPSPPAAALPSSIRPQPRPPGPEDEVLTLIAEKQDV